MRFKNFDFTLLFTAVAIFGIGLAAIYSATYQQDYKLGGFLPQSFLLRQIIWFILSLLVATVVLMIDYQKWLELAYPLYGLQLILLSLVLFTGDIRLGAQRWLNFGSITLQPAEFSKLVVILVLVRYLGQKNTRGAFFF